MHARQPFPDDLWRVLHRQSDVATRAQLLAGGLSDSQIARLVRHDVLNRFDRSVDLLGRNEPSWPQYASAGVLLGGTGARLLGMSSTVVLAGRPTDHSERTPGCPVRSRPTSEIRDHYPRVPPHYRRLSDALQRRQRIRNRRLIEEVIGEIRDGARSPLDVR